MPASVISAAISASIEDYRLLDHPYYRAWQDGELRMGDLKSYAEQYRHFERCLPEALADVATQMEEGEPRDLVGANLADERSNPRPHLELFDYFGAAVGAAGSAGATSATSELVGLYEEAAETGPVALLSVVAAYEVQGAEVARTKAAALAVHYGLHPAEAEFWTVHATVEEQHSAWTVEALAGLGAAADQVTHWSTRSAQAWWQFLDERDTARRGLTSVPGA